MDYILYIHDTRYSAPTLLVVSAGCDQRAHEIARLRLVDSPHHQLVEIWRDDEQVGLLLRDPAG